MDQNALAAAASIARGTLIDFEKEKRIPTANNLAAIRAALEAAGVIFVDENGEGPGVRLRKHLALAELNEKIEALDAKTASLDVAGAPSPRRALNQLKKAHVENEKTKLVNKRAKATRKEKP